MAEVKALKGTNREELLDAFAGDYAWSHRGSGEMAVVTCWHLNNATRPAMPPTVASESKVSASHMVKAINAINDGLLPRDEFDRSAPYYHW